MNSGVGSNFGKFGTEGRGVGIFALHGIGVPGQGVRSVGSDGGVDIGFGGIPWLSMVHNVRRLVVMISRRRECRRF